MIIWPEPTEPMNEPSIIGIVSRPASVGLYPRAIWKYWPRNSALPNIATPTDRLATIASAVVRSRTTFSGTSGSAARVSTNTASTPNRIVPPTNSADCQEIQPKS